MVSLLIEMLDLLLFPVLRVNSMKGYFSFICFGCFFDSRIHETTSPSKYANDIVLEELELLGKTILRKNFSVLYPSIDLCLRVKKNVSH